MQTTFAKKFGITISLILTLLILDGCAAMVASTAATGYMVAQDRRTAGTIVEDKSIEFKASQEIRKILEDDPTSNISIISYNNRVLLVGQTPDDNLRKKVENAVSRVAKVKKLHNEIALQPKVPMLTKSNDSWITTRIKAQLFLNKEINPTRVKVLTEDGTVYLIGLVTPEEEKIAVDIARHAKGVRKVVKIFEYEEANNSHFNSSNAKA